MNTTLLFPYYFRFIGWGLILAFLGTWAYLELNPDSGVEDYLTVHISNNWLSDFYDTTSLNFTDEIMCIALITGLLFVGFSREKLEDEMINQLRLKALQASVYLNYALLMLAIVLIYGLEFYNVLMYNMFTVLLFFILYFQLTLRKNRRSVRRVLAF
ncbi:hypothetical protein [Arsenicibacter rosenii]|uniref:Uncharacterized protein n=1 Tax=Arsenicibacter rosenii TaxID=1750698 RepID=A0A1S2VHP1_9BACT|nr:hypothetical protein [Arsenicibacter rosenii]OIN58249.1 hypothetical protein BLX24_14675 [Arsenicibacter rosenii]